MLYHKDVFLPRRIKASVPQGTYKLIWSNHAIQAANTDRYGKIQTVHSLDFRACDIIEVEYYSTGIKKLVLRLTGDDKDVIFVVTPQGKDWLVKTVWINVASDNHKTLDKRIYAKAK